MITEPQHLLLDQLFVKLFQNMKLLREDEMKKNKLTFIKISTDDEAIAADVDRAIISVRHHEDKYERPFTIENARQIQTSPIKNAVFDIVAQFCKKTTLSDEAGYQAFKDYFEQIPFLNGRHGQRDVLSKIQQLRGPQRSASQ